MQQEKLERAVELAKKELKILQDPQSKLYPVTLQRLQNMNLIESIHRPEAAAPSSSQANEQAHGYLGSNSSLVIGEPGDAKPKRTTPRKAGRRLSQQPAQQLDSSPAVGPVPSRNSALEAKSHASPAGLLQSTPRHKTPKSLAPQDLVVKFYSSRPISPSRKKLAEAESKPTDFVVPRLETISGTRSGLVKKDKMSDLEKMREESDARLEKALQHSAARQKALEKEKSQKKAKLAGKYSNIPSRIGTPSKNAANPPKPTYPPSASSKKAAGTGARPKQRPLGPSTRDNTSTLTKTKPTIRDTIKASMEALLEKENVPVEVSAKPAKPRENSRTSNPNLAKRPSVTSSIPSTQPQSRKGSLKPMPPTMPDQDAIIERLVEALGAKIDPVLVNVQQKWERAAAEIDAKLATIPPGPTVVRNGDPEIEMVEQLLDMAEPSVLYDSEAIAGLIHVSNAAAPEPDVLDDLPDEHDYLEDQAVVPIVIENAQQPRKSATARIDSSPARETVLVLPEYLVQSIVDSRERRNRWNKAYFGSDFNPALVLERYGLWIDGSIGQEVLLQMIDGAVGEIAQASEQFVGELVENEL
ncbi:hypothetical protein HDV03_000764 [Kappamyces sp. JEL0829]|nr:hypothetical protein HDV03_000764 [Kappamyces sp. JEL0829]